MNGQRPEAMDTATVSVHLPALRIAYGVFILAFGVLWATIAIFVGEDEGGGPLAIINAAVGLTYGPLVLRSKVRASREAIVVRNRFRTYRIPWADVSDIRLQQIPRTLWQRLGWPKPERTSGVIQTADGSEIRMFATERTSYGTPEGFFGVPRNVQDVEKLLAFRATLTSTST